MSRQKRNWGVDSAFALAVLIIYLGGQVLIGTYLPTDRSLHFDAPADGDFLYYAGIINQMKHSFPPQNPGYGGITLSQSFVQYYPTVLASFVMNPYLAMRVVNIMLLLALAYVLRRYFPKGWGIGLALVTASSIGFGLINSLAVDLVARGFNHFPFFIALTVALFEQKNRWLKYVCLFLLGWLHSFSALIVFVYFVAVFLFHRFKKPELADSLICLAGLLTAAGITAGVADKPPYFPFVEGFGISLRHVWMHAVPAALLVASAGNARITILAGVAFVYALLFHYNPFFPVFMLYFAGGWGGMELVRNRRMSLGAPVVLAAILFIGFLYSSQTKYDPRNGQFAPHFDQDYAQAGEWLEKNTAADAVLLTAPLESDWNCRLMETRAVYLGFPPHIAHLGIDWRQRAQKILNYYRKPSVYMAETDYVVYGPNERNLFPDFSLDERPVYRDGLVAIWKVAR